MRNAVDASWSKQGRPEKRKRTKQEGKFINFAGKGEYAIYMYITGLGDGRL